MNQKFLYSLVAVVLTTFLGTVTPSHAQSEQLYKSSNSKSSQSIFAQGDESITKIVPHEFSGYQAATLYLRGTPLLMFLSSRPINEVSLPSQQRLVQIPEDDPIWKAQQVATKLNQLGGNNLNKSAIAVVLEPTCNCYTIKVNSQALVQINGSARLPNTTNNLAEDALEIASQLRRVLTESTTVVEIPVPTPPPSHQAAVGSVIRSTLQGIASWYGPGFHGRRSANGERYNQNALTAAHRSLPFGTQVQVTNLKNNRSVIVRINDRGPFIRGRVIDLSAAAARTIGITQTGVAPVRIDVLDPQQITASNN
ncbi:MAG TPA: septal ring lytic transglycosylase RlpA family protein [Oculatellaceae cyanobacterium]|jgi:rare lipoprotein A